MVTTKPAITQDRRRANCNGEAGEAFWRSSSCIIQARRNVRRKFQSTVSAEQVQELMTRYQTLYAFAATALPRFLNPSDGKWASDKDVRLEEFRAHVAGHYRQEPKSVIDTVTAYAMLYEYLM